MTLERLDLSRINAEASTVPSYGLIANGEIKDPILQPLLVHFPKEILKSSADSVRKTQYFTQGIIIVAETDVLETTREYTDLHIENKTGKILLDILEILGKEISIESTDYRDCVLDDKSGIRWLGPYDLDEILSLFHEWRHLLNERNMSNDDFTEYQQAHRLLTWGRKHEINSRTMEKIRQIEWQCWEEAHDAIKTSGLEQLLFTGIQDNVIRRHALSCYRSYL